MKALRSVECVPLPDMNDDPKEKRRSPRVHCRVPVTLRTSDGRDLSAMCLDINFNGIGIETSNRLAVGQRVELMVPGKLGDATSVPMLVIFRMDTHYGLSALGAHEHVLDLLPIEA